MKIAVAMSGGIDSSVAAVILKEQGHSLIGITARFTPRSDLNDKIFNDALSDSKKISSMFSFPHYQFDYSQIFRKNVIEYFCSEYLLGRTPNPCVICNRFVKFKLLLEEAKRLGCDMIATGHYTLKKNEHDRFYLSMSPDRSKDQSYFLFMLTQDQLASTLFPVGNMTKNQVRDYATAKNLPLKDKPDSQEICFIPDNDYIKFIESYAGVQPRPGNIINSCGQILGKHNGIYRYTIGQRRGMGISAAEPLYVTAIDPSENTITAGPKSELYTKSFETLDSFHMKYEISKETTLFIKARSTQTPIEGIVSNIGDRFSVTFTEPQTGISPGQSAVFYDSNNDLIGGGIIEKTF